MSVDVYTYNFTLQINPAGNASEIFRLVNVQRTMKIKSINYQVKTFGIVGAVFNYWNDSTKPATVNYRLTVGNGLMTSNKIGKSLIKVGGTGVLTDTGNYFTLDQAGIYYYDSFFISEQIDFLHYCENTGANDIFNWVSVTIETESKTIF